MLWTLHISNIVEVDLESSILGSSIFIREGIIAKPDESILVIRMEVGRVSWHLEFSEDLRCCRNREIDDEEWIYLLEGDEVQSIPDKACGLEVFPRSNPSQRTNHLSLRTQD